MSKTYEFLKKCGTFYVATVNENAPAVRPFGAVMEYEGELYISTAKYKDVYNQFIKSEIIQIIALKAETRDWIRINGKAVETQDMDTKQAMLDACPNLAKRFDRDNKHYALFRITEMSSSMNVNGEFVKLT